MKLILLSITGIILTINSLCAQEYSGLVFDKKTGYPIEYVNIGIVGKNIGTVSDNNGKYKLSIDSHSQEDSLTISCIGYFPYSKKVSEFKNLENHNIYLKERIFRMDEVVVSPKIFKQKTLGVTTKTQMAQGGFSENQLGYECGILMKIKKSAIIETVNLNIATCTYDSIFYRINIYKVRGKNSFENILRNPIYLNLAKKQLNETVVMDLKSHNIQVQGDILVTLEHVKDLGEGYLYFSTGLSNKTYFRKTSQAFWETVPIGVSISVDAKVEK